MIIKNNSYAQTGFKEFNGSPRMEIIVNEKKFDDAKIESIFLLLILILFH